MTSKVHPPKLLNEKDNSCDLHYPEVVFPSKSAFESHLALPKGPPFTTILGPPTTIKIYHLKITFDPPQIAS